MDELIARIDIGDGLVFDSETHLWIYFDLLRISSESDAVIERLDVFAHLLGYGFTYREANQFAAFGPTAYKLARATMKLSEMQNS